MRPLILLWLLVMLSSCHSSRHSAASSADSLELSIRRGAMVSAADSLIVSFEHSKSGCLTDVVIDFFPPDPSKPEEAPAPKRLHFRQASFNDSTRSEVSSGSVSFQAEADSIEALHHSEASEVENKDPPASRSFPWLWAIVALSGVAIYFRFFR